MISRRALLAAGPPLALGLLWSMPSSANSPTKNECLPTIGPAPDFTLTAQDGRAVSLGSLRGRVVAVTFIYTSCTDSCPLLTAKLVAVQRGLPADTSGRTFFVGITLDPERDTADVLEQYARRHGADSSVWAFLTGPVPETRAVARRYGIYLGKQPRAYLDHTSLTSVVDQTGTLRVQYIGARFDPEEMKRDISRLIAEPKCQ